MKLEKLQCMWNVDELLYITFQIPYSAKWGYQKSRNGSEIDLAYFPILLLPTVWHPPFCTNNTELVHFNHTLSGVGRTRLIKMMWPDSL